MLVRSISLALVLALSGCSSWVYKRDIPQGNFVEQRDIDKLQIQMTKEQVKFVLGTPVVEDPFSSDVWHYVYRFKSGKSSDLNISRKFTVYFENDRVVKAEGDYELPESFYTLW